MKTKRSNCYDDRKRLAGFRLEIAVETVRYVIDTTAGSLDISGIEEIAELCDEYALRTLCIWLATKDGCPVCTCAICSATGSGATDLICCLQQSGEYPFGIETSCAFQKLLLEVAEKTLSAFSERSLGLLGTLYEQVLNQRLYIDPAKPHPVRIDIQNKEFRRTNGQFYTPPSVVKHCLDIALNADSAALMKRLKGAVLPAEGNSIDFKVLDPSCGTGNFLWGLLEYLKRMYENEAIDWAGALGAFCRSSLHGVELDPRACSLARVAICIYFLRELDAAETGGNCRVPILSGLLDSLRANIIVSDTVFLAAAKDGATGEFDLVITNPPYVSFGARNQPTLPESSGRFLKRFYPDSAEYKVRYHSIFQEIALRFARQSGSAVLLVPDGFLTGSFYERLRNKLISVARVASLTELPEGTIDEAVVGRWCIAHYVKERPSCDYQVQIESFSKRAEPPLRYALPLAVFLSPDRKRFRLIFNDADACLMRVSDSCQPLAELLRGHTGIRSRLGKDAVVSAVPKTSSWQRGITSGREVVPYKIAWQGNWINVDASILFGGGFDRRIIENPKILVRQTGDCMIGAVDEACLYHLNNVHSFSYRNGAAVLGPDGLFYLCGLINSKLWRHIYRLKTREEGRALAQVDIETVETMPLPLYDEKKAAEIASLVKRLSHQTVTADSERANSLIFFIRQRIDAIVYRMYGLDSETISHIERCQNALK